MIILTCTVLFLAVTKLQAQVTSDPDTYEEVPGIVRRYGYNFESYTVTTDDGYILQLFRIPSKVGATDTKPKQPILVQHGLVADSSTFVLSKNDSLAFVLVDEGYDVWMGNYRGCHYSLKHVKYNTSQFAFWDFSWDEMAEIDLPLFFKYIYEATNQKAIYVGHSMGTTTFFASMSMFPENDKYVKAMFALAPVGYTAHVKGAFRLLSEFSLNYEWISRVLGFGEYVPNDNLASVLVKYGCNLLGPKLTEICHNAMFMMEGFDPDGFNMDYFPAMSTHISSTSVRTVVHFSQQVKPKTFQKYDFGKKMNLEKYGTIKPPVYNVTNIRVPIAFYCGENDWLSQKPDQDTLWDEIPNKILRYTVPSPTFDHMDFLFGKNLKTLLLDQLLEDIRKQL